MLSVANITLRGVSHRWPNKYGTLTEWLTKNSSCPRKSCRSATVCTKNAKTIPSQNEPEPLQTAAGDYVPQQWYGRCDPEVNNNMNHPVQQVIMEWQVCVLQTRLSS